MCQREGGQRGGSERQRQTQGGGGGVHNITVCFTSLYIPVYCVQSVNVHLHPVHVQCIHYVSFENYMYM